MTEPTKLSKAAARDLTKRIGGLMGELEELVIDAWRGFADEALGYKTWEEYIESEVPDLPRFNLPKRQAAVKKITEATAETERGQMTAAEVASTLGVSEPTVKRDRAATSGSTKDQKIPATSTSTSAAAKPSKITVSAAPDTPVNNVTPITKAKPATKPDITTVVNNIATNLDILKGHKFADLTAVDKRKLRSVYKALVAFIGTAA